MWWKLIIQTSASCLPPTILEYCKDMTFPGPPIIIKIHPLTVSGKKNSGLKNCTNWWIRFRTSTCLLGKMEIGHFSGHSKCLYCALTKQHNRMQKRLKDGISIAIYTHYYTMLKTTHRLRDRVPRVYKTKEGSILWLDPNGIGRGAKNKKKGASFRFGICLLQEDIRKGPFKIGKITWNCSWLKCVCRTILSSKVLHFVS